LIQQVRSTSTNPQPETAISHHSPQADALGHAPQKPRSPDRCPDRSRRSARRFGSALLASAAVLGGTALLVHKRAQRAEREHPPKGQFLDTNGVHVHYVERGKGQPVVLLHGNGTMIQDFEISGVMDLAVERYRVIAFDRPGFGHTSRPRRRIWTPAAQAELLHEALKRLGVERPIVVGHSWGTLVALALALEHPDEIGGLVLLSGYYFPTARADVPLLSPPAIPVVGDVMRYTISPLLGRLLTPKIIRKVFAPAPVTTRFAAEFPVELALRPSQIRASAGDTALMIPAAASLNHRYRELTMQVVIMAGAEDEIVDVERQSKRLHAELPHGDLHLVEGGGHMIHHLVPWQVVGAINSVADQARERAAVQRRAAE
jgi:pimeloyl-ACP methyl ester carboxylesterase